MVSLATVSADGWDPATHYNGASLNFAEWDTANASCPAAVDQDHGMIVFESTYSFYATHSEDDPNLASLCLGYVKFFASAYQSYDATQLSYVYHWPSDGVEFTVYTMGGLSNAAKGLALAITAGLFF